MLCFLTPKSYTGHEPEAIWRGLEWLFTQNSADLYIYSEDKDHARDLLPDDHLFKTLKAKNTVCLKDVKLHLFFGTGPGAHNGDVPPLSSSNPVLILHGKPERLGWVLERFAKGAVCLVPWAPEEGLAWQQSYGAVAL